MHCSAELKKAIRLVDKMDELDKDVKVLIDKQLEFTPEAIIICYQGDCTLCAKHSLGCDPEAKCPWPKLFVPAANIVLCRFHVIAALTDAVKKRCRRLKRG